MLVVNLPIFALRISFFFFFLLNAARSRAVAKVMRESSFGDCDYDVTHAIKLKKGKAFLVHISCSVLLKFRDGTEQLHRLMKRGVHARVEHCQQGCSIFVCE